MIRSFLLLVIIAFVSAAALQAQSVDPKIQGMIDAWLDARHDAKRTTPAAFAKKLGEAGATIASVEKALRAGRASYPPLEWTPGKLEKGIPLACEHVDYETSCFLYLPKAYSAKTLWPLLIVGHGGNSEMSQERAEQTAESYVQAWLPEAERQGFVLAAPVSARGWDWIGNSILLSLISTLQRKLAIDPDRIYPTGHSMGGHMAWRCGIFYGDRWGAVGPMSGGYDYVANGQVLTLFNVPGYGTHGTDEPYEITTFNRRIREWMATRGYDWQLVEKKGGHEIFPDEVPKQLEFFAKHPRDLYRDRLSIRAEGRMRIDKSEPKKARWPVDHKWREERPIVSETFHWVRLAPLPDGTPDDRKVQRAWVVLKSRREIAVTARNVPKLRLYLHERMVDLDKPLTVTVNGRKQAVQPKKDLAALLDLVREFDDRGRIFQAHVDLAIDGGADVPDPSRE